MECAAVREALSARLDGESPGMSDAAVDHHLDGCRACTAWSDELTTLHRMVRVRAADAVPDLSASIVDAFEPTRRAAGRRGLARRLAVLGEPVSTARWALFVVALTKLILSGPALFGDDPGATVHIAREAGSFGVALAVGFLVAAWQPARAWGLLPVAVTLALVMAATAAFDLADGHTTMLVEAHHLLDLAGVLLLWRVAHEVQQRPIRSRAATARRA